MSVSVSFVGSNITTRTLVDEQNIKDLTERFKAYEGRRIAIVVPQDPDAPSTEKHARIGVLKSVTSMTKPRKIVFDFDGYASEFYYDSIKNTWWPFGKCQRYAYLGKSSWKWNTCQILDYDDLTEFENDIESKKPTEEMLAERRRRSGTDPLDPSCRSDV